MQVEKLKFQITNLTQDQVTNEMLAHAAHILNSFKATGSNTDRTLIFQTVDQFFDFCSTKPRRIMDQQARRVQHYGRLGGKSWAMKILKINFLIQDRKKKMGIRNLPEKPTNWILGKIKKFFSNENY